MAELSDEQKRKMKQSMVDAANMSGEEAMGGMGQAVNKVFGGGRTQDLIGQKYIPATASEDAAAMRNADASNPDSVAAVRQRLIAAERAKMAMQPKEMPEAMPESGMDLSAMANQSADERMRQEQSQDAKKQMMLNLLKQKRGY